MKFFEGVLRLNVEKNENLKKVYLLITAYLLKTNINLMFFCCLH